MILKYFNDFGDGYDFEPDDHDIEQAIIESIANDYAISQDTAKRIMTNFELDDLEHYGDYWHDYLWEYFKDVAFEEMSELENGRLYH